MPKFLILLFVNVVIVKSQDITKPATLVVEEGNNFQLKCTVERVWQNVTWILPTAVMNSTYFQTMSNLNDRSTFARELNSFKNATTASLTVRNASYLDTGFYNCQHVDYGNTQKSKLFEVHYVFVHPRLLSDDQEEILSDDLLLPTLDFYVLRDSTPGFLNSFRPTHPNVSFFLSKKDANGRWMEVYSNMYDQGIEHDKWFLDKYRGLEIKHVAVTQTCGQYWCDAKLGSRTTSRYFRIFVTTSDSVGNFTKSIVPRIKDVVEFRIFPTGSEFRLDCHFGTSANWNVTWKVPDAVLRAGTFKIRYFKEENGHFARLTVSRAIYLFTGYYDCFRTDNNTLKDKQYVFISDSDRLILPLKPYYILEVAKFGIIPCRPTHPDVFVSLHREGHTSRGFENITLAPKDHSEWEYDKTVGFKTTTVTRSMAGTKYLCKGENKERFFVEQNQVFDIIVLDIQLSVIYQHGSTLVVDGDEVVIECTAYNQELYLEWIPNHGGARRNFSTAADRLSNRTEITEFLELKKHTLQLAWHNISFDAEGTYTCRYKDIRLKHNSSQPYKMNVQVAKAPFISNTSNLSEEAVEGSSVTLFCHESTGAPPPIVIWLQDGQEVNSTIYFITSSNGTSSLTFEASKTSSYTCRFVNRVGKAEELFYVEVIASYDSATMIAIVVVLAIIAIILGIVARILYVKFNKRGNELRDMQDAAKCLEPLLAGNPERINPFLPLDEQSELLPYDRRWEFPRNRLKLGQQLGAGCFGRVVLAEADGIIEESVVETVAVKMVRSYANTSALTSLVGELKILIHLGSHVNIVNLLGSCTDIVNGDFLVIVEYCRFDNLHNYIIANRKGFVNHLDKDGDLLPLSCLPTPSAGHQQGYMMMNNPSATSSRSTNAYVDLVYNNPHNASALYRPQAGEGEDEHGQLSTRDLISWAFQISRGMDYLSSRHVIHGDLAARNVLLADKSVAKVADFGLSRKVYQDSNYKKRGEGMLPVKWMAIESLTERIFSSQSDVWAFGVVLWELFSLGKAPYPEFEDIAPLIRHLESGSRMEIPTQAPKFMADIIKDCWKANPDIRPTFAQLEQSIGDEMEAETRKFYVDLNDPYIKRNEMRMNTTSSGYTVLKDRQQPSASEPLPADYMNVSGPSTKGQSNPSNNQATGETSAYLVMSAPK